MRLDSPASQPVPHSSGVARPRQPAPPWACDAHLHILDARFANVSAVPPDMDVAAYSKLQAQIGTRRAVVVQAKNYGIDNDCLLDAVAQLGEDGVGIAVVHPDVTDAELRRLNAGRVRGLRFSVWNPANAVATVDMIEPLARRIAPLGWHAQLHMSGDQLVAHEDLIARLPCAVVIDHMGRLPPDSGVAHPGFAVMRRLLDGGRNWVKLSGAYLKRRSSRPRFHPIHPPLEVRRFNEGF